MLLILCVIMMKMIRSERQLSGRRRRSKPKRRVVDMDILTGIEVERDIVLVVGAIEETAEIGDLIGM